ncbi:hypothetical protein MA16_Dca024305 [Dendrobium catenatum]|uniref:Uncharacterized protein n=1 Tax=Dendrobium catenatum TaxID=906689 RepID=A0A2I0X6G7_9ASPA|nr:hypothetical protein MA16_Dca024305 [Dendrobium catenatum]
MWYVSSDWRSAAKWHRGINGYDSGPSEPSGFAAKWHHEIPGVHPCDRRRTIREYQTLFPAVDFSLVIAIFSGLHVEAEKFRLICAWAGPAWTGWTGPMDRFGNCELRSMVIVDKSLLGFGTDRTNFPGRIPRGLDLPSDIAHDKHPNATGDH